MTITEDHEYGRPVWTDKLALRPTVFSETAHHPGPSPCPAWCVEAIDGDVHPLAIYGHAGGGVLHDSEIVTSRASLYTGTSERGEAQFATLSTHLERDGRRDTIHVGRRSWTYPGPKMQYQGDLLELTVEDARELAAVLTHLADMADMADSG